MKIRTTALIVSTLVIGLSVVPATSAGPGHKNAKDPLVPLAYDVEKSARRVHKAAERMAHHGTYREQRALQRMHELDRQARNFRRVVERRAFYARDVRHAHLDLQQAFRDARFAMRQLHAFRPIEREFDRLDRAMNRLDLRYDTLLAGVRRDRRGPRDHHRVRVGRAHSTVRIGTSWDNGHASIGFNWHN
jgi:hypothetical protein